MMPETFILDWNGTVLADAQACLHGVNRALKHLAMPPATMTAFRHHYAMPFNRLYHGLGCTQAMLEAHEEAMLVHWREGYQASRIRLRRGAASTLEALRNASHEILVLSNYVTPEIEAQARAFRIRHHIDHILAFEPHEKAFNRPSKKDRLKKYLAQNEVSIGTIVGDTEEEIEIGRELGLRTIAITNGTCSTRRLRAMRPDHLIHNLTELVEIVRKNSL